MVVISAGVERTSASDFSKLSNLFFSRYVDFTWIRYHTGVPKNGEGGCKIYICLWRYTAIYIYIYIYIYGGLPLSQNVPRNRVGVLLKGLDF